MFYSGSIFEHIGVDAFTASVLINVVNLVATFAAIPLLNKFGRKNLLMITFAACAVFEICEGVAYKFCEVPLPKEVWKNTCLVSTLFFVVSFAFGPGPITWMYMSEITNDKGTSVATFVNWFFTLIMALFTSSLLDKMHGYLFIMFGLCCAFASLFIALFMKETKGLSELEIKRLYRTDRDIINEFEEKKRLGFD